MTDVVIAGAGLASSLASSGAQARAGGITDQPRTLPNQLTDTETATLPAHPHRAGRTTNVAIAGAGLPGSLVATVARASGSAEGRSINLGLAQRRFRALREVEPLEEGQ